jgi:hypothetical protein
MWNKQLSCADAQYRLTALLEGSLGEQESRQVKAHLRQCSSCHQAFLKMAAGGIFRAQVGFRSGVRGAPWAYLQSLAAKNVAWAKTELDRVRDAFRGALTLFSLPQWQPKVKNIGIAPVMGNGKSQWPKYIAVAVVDDLGQQRNTVRFEVLQPPTVTPAGDFLLTLRSAEATNLADWTFLCTVESVEGVQVTFEGKIQPEQGNNGWQVELKADGLPVCEKDVVIPPERVRLSLQGGEGNA